MLLSSLPQLHLFFEINRMDRTELILYLSLSVTKGTHFSPPAEGPFPLDKLGTKARNMQLRFD